MPSRTIGLTFFLRAKDQSIWNNGAEQNCAFLWMLLRAAGYRVLAVNGGDGEVPSPSLSELGIEFVRFADVASEIDLLIEGAPKSAPSRLLRCGPAAAERSPTSSATRS